MLVSRLDVSNNANSEKGPGTARFNVDVAVAEVGKIAEWNLRAAAPHASCTLHRSTP